jgi:Leucine-rich repeat (LRR) protein
LFGLSVKNSLIIKVTDKITSLQRLESLTLDNCSLSEMPSLDGMPKLLRVTLPNNRLSKLEGLMSVRQLFLYHNLLTSIPTQTETDALTQIYMNYNPVNDISMITAYKNLTELRLSNTEVTFIPESIDQWRREEVKSGGGYFENGRKCAIFRKSEKILDEFSSEFRRL